jgi:hypothetical protein
MTTNTWPGGRTQLPGRRRVGSHRRAAHAAGRTRLRRAGPSRSGTGSASPVAARILACLLCVAGTGAAIRETTLFRGMEAQLAGHVASLVSVGPTGSVPALAEFWFGPARHELVGLQISTECTVALLTVPFLLGTACLVWIRPSVMRPLMALCAAVASLIALNQLRFLAIDALIRVLGFDNGYYWGHRWLGSIITVIGTAAVIGIFALMVAAKGDRRAEQDCS